ncbi:MAG: hypothetical protein ACXWUG_07860 [Polyangiales bacterium]
MHMRKDRFGGRAVVASAAFFLVSALEVGRLLTGQHWPELTFAGSNIELALVPLWLAAGIGLVARKAWAWPLVIVADMALLGHGGIIGMAGSPLVSFFVLAGGFAAFGSILRHYTTYGVRTYVEEPVPVRVERPLRPSYG